ncbi:MAG: HlyD family secretion protein [Candidatus Latescibacterota bacterium]|jgi:multidrug resistance efflux pump
MKSDLAKEESEEKTPNKVDPIRRVTRIVLIVAAVIFVWYLFADRLTPYTDQARVQGLVVPIVPRVSGYLTEVNVRLHSIVEQDEVLFVIDQRPYELAVQSAEANLDNTAQQVGALTATVKSAAGRVGVARAQLDRAQRNYNRTQAILEKNPGALSQADRDRTETSLAQAVERLSSAEADLDKAKEQLGITGPENPQLRAAVAALEQAQLDLAFTTLYAPARGAIESFNIDLGFYAVAGQPLAMLVSTTDAWIQADMRENNISRVEPGDPVEFVLDVAPARVFKGTVRSVGYGVGSSGVTSRGELPTIKSSQGWLRDPQRFPVIIGFDRVATSGLLRVGGQADVIIYTGGNPILNLIGKLQIRVRSLLSYVR